MSTSDPRPNSPLEHIFVYGTLKRGECREGCWPRIAANIRPAWTSGSLVDLGPYPALIAGHDHVRGELWSFHPADVEAVLHRLDQVEVTDQPGLVNEYDRIRVTVTLDDGQTESAYAYRFSEQQPLPAVRRLTPNMHFNGQAFVVWPDSRSS